MADIMLKPLTPLGTDTPARTTIGPVTITEVTDTALASLAARMGQSLAEAAKAAGLPLPAPGRAEQAAPYGAFWLGPDQWMIEAPYPTHEDITAILKPVFGETASLTEQTDAWARFDVTGEHLPALFERLCNFDIAAHSTGAATRTMLEHLGVYIVIRAPNHITILGPRSSAASLYHALTTAAKAAY